jgi:hypothetical protein
LQENQRFTSKGTSKKANARCSALGGIPVLQTTQTPLESANCAPTLGAKEATKNIKKAKTKNKGINTVKSAKQYWSTTGTAVIVVENIGKSF